MATPKKTTKDQRAAQRRLIDRIRAAERIAEDPKCFAHDVDELERVLPLRDLAAHMRFRSLLSDRLLEKGLRRLEIQCGDPDDPFEKREIQQYYIHDLLQSHLIDVMLREGSAGFRAMGGLVTRLGRDHVAHGRELSTRRRERLAQAAAAGTDLTAVPNEDDEERAVLAEERRRADRLTRRWEKEDAEARKAWEALTPAEREAQKRREREMEDEEMRQEEDAVAKWVNERDASPTSLALRSLFGQHEQAKQEDGAPEAHPSAEHEARAGGEPDARGFDEREADEQVANRRDEFDADAASIAPRTGVGTPVDRAPPDGWLSYQAPAPPADVIEASRAAWQKRREADERRDQEQLEALRRFHLSDGPTAPPDPSMASSQTAVERGPAALGRREFEEAGTDERIDGVIMADAEQDGVFANGCSRG